MEFFDVVRKRKSVRKYTGRPIGKWLIERIVRAGIQAPYGTGEAYPVRFVAVTKKPTIKAVYGCMRAQDWHRFVLDAGAVIVVALRTDIPGGVADAHAACENMLLAVTALGLGACWIGAFEEEKVRKALKLSAKHQIIAILSLGEPAERPEVVERPPVKDMLIWR
jgi:nitroreductase